MTSAASLTWTTSPWMIAATVLVIAATAVLSVVTWRRSGWRRSIGCLELLRVVIVAFAALLLNQPEWVEEFRPTNKPAIAVLHDASASMDTRDILDSENAAAPAVSRRDAISSVSSRSTWSGLSEKFDVIIEPIAGESREGGSNLYEPLAAAPEKISRLLGVVLASDGDWNLGEPPVVAAAKLRLKGIPVLVVPVGRRDRLPDVELASLDAPTFGVACKSVRIPFTIDSSLPREYIANVVLKTSNGDELTTEVRIAPQGRTTDAIIWKPKEVGDYELTLEVPPHSGETIADNNKLTAPISIREEKLRVLVVESHPRWEYRYLRNALSRDPGVEVSCLLFHPGLSKVGGGNKDYIKEFPAGRDELAKYDVVFLGDVGLEDGQLTSEQCHFLRGLVEQQASGLVFMPGMDGRQFSLLETDLADLYPVALDEAQPGGWGSRLPNKFELTELGRRSLLTKLADSPEENSEVWDSLPGFQWYAPVLRAKAGAEVLCVHEEATNRYGRLPLLVTRAFGAGKVLFMGTDGAWRWRKGVEDKYHYRFWGQVVRWMAYRRNMAKGETMRLYYAPDQPAVRQTVVLSTNVMEPSGEPLSKGDVLAHIESPSGKSETVRFTSSGDEWGAFAGNFTPQEPGKHSVTLSCPQTGGTLETSIYVQGAAIEPVGKAARPEVLEEIARVTRGAVFAPDDISKVIDYLAQLPEPPASVRRVRLWGHPATIGVVILLLGTFWVGRKAVGLI
jgi:hypothetical protein